MTIYIDIPIQFRKISNKNLPWCLDNFFAQNGGWSDFEGHNGYMFHIKIIRWNSYIF